MTGSPPCACVRASRSATEPLGPSAGGKTPDGASECAPWAMEEALWTPRLVGWLLVWASGILGLELLLGGGSSSWHSGLWLQCCDYLWAEDKLRPGGPT